MKQDGTDSEIRTQDLLITRNGHVGTYGSKWFISVTLHMKYDSDWFKIVTFSTA